MISRRPVLAYIYGGDIDRRPLKRSRSPGSDISADIDAESAKRRLKKIPMRRMRIRRYRRQQPAAGGDMAGGASMKRAVEDGHRGELLLATAAAAAPTNTTQFLMGEHCSANNSPDSDWERFHSETEFESREFAKDFHSESDQSCGRSSSSRGRLFKNELIAEYLAMEKVVQVLEKQYEEWRSRLATTAIPVQECGGLTIRPPAAVVDQIRRVRDEIGQLTRENQLLTMENSQLRTENRRRRHGVGTVESGSSSSESSSSESSSSSSSSSCSSCCDSSSEAEEDEDDEKPPVTVAQLCQPARSDNESSRSSGSTAPAGDDRRDDTGYESDRSSSVSLVPDGVTSSTLFS